jgi:hypothetical protein
MQIKPEVMMRTVCQSSLGQRERAVFILINTHNPGTHEIDIRELSASLLRSLSHLVPRPLKGPQVKPRAQNDPIRHSTGHPEGARTRRRYINWDGELP